MRIPITMCHGVERTASGDEQPLTAGHFARLIAIVAELGFRSISYDDLAAWRAGTGKLPERPIMLDFDHPVVSMRYEVFETLDRYGFKGNLFVNTGPIDDLYRSPLAPQAEREIMTWDELAELAQAGWHLGAHTVTHPNLSAQSLQDPTGEAVRAELLANNAAIRRGLGITPVDFAFTGTSWSSAAEREVARLYRFGRLWIVGPRYQADGKEVRFADLVGVPGPDEADGGPPKAARYITRYTLAYRLPSMEIQALIYTEEAFRAYLEESQA
jgi:peptidoglycan/xylan/chitin deacetylase (PgdA/CDA1 family)